MRITNLPAYQHIYQKFESGEFKPGIASELPVYTYDVNETDNLTERCSGLCQRKSWKEIQSKFLQRPYCY